MLLATIASLNLSASAADSPRERLSMDFGCKFHLGDGWGLAENLEKAGENRFQRFRLAIVECTA
jgi:hypothetical protein